MIPRTIPCLLLADGKLVKTTRFRDPIYVGDPINAVRIFNDKEADELVILDIGASARGTAPDYDLIESIVTEAFMPVAYGGGIASVDDATRVIQLGVEKVVVNSAAAAQSTLVSEIANRLGRSTLVVGIDAARNPDDSYAVLTHSATRRTEYELEAYARLVADAGAGEILLTSVDRDGMRDGYDLDLIRRVVESVRIPVVACGGAGQLKHLSEAVKDGGAAAAAAGSLFFFYGKHRAVLITYPSYERRRELFAE